MTMPIHTRAANTSRVSGTALLTALLTALMACTAFGLRPPTWRESTLRVIAEQLAAPEICDKIAWAASVPAGIDHAPFYERSHCYFNIAARTGNSEICRQVRPLGVHPLARFAMTQSSCIEAARRKMTIASAAPDSDLVKIFAQMGYDPDSFPMSDVRNSIVNVRWEYEAIARQPDIVSRIARDSANDPYLADLAAMVSHEPQWCDHIALKDVSGTIGVPSRDWCLFKLASNQRDTTVCAPLSSQYIKSCKSTASRPTPPHYFPELPEDSHARALIAQLGYPMQYARDQSVNQLGDAYFQFLLKIGSPRTPAQSEARRQLIERALAVRDTVPDDRAQHAVMDENHLHALVEDRDTPPEVLADIAARTTKFDDLLIYDRLADSTRELVLHRLSTSPDLNRRGQVARLPWVSQALLQQLSTDTTWYVREQVAMSPRAEPALLRQLAADKWFLVRIAIANNPHTPDDVMAALKDDLDARVRSAAEKGSRLRR